jgi:subtilase family serine protease
LQGLGSGQTIAIVDAFDDPKLVDSTASNFSSSDLHTFDAQYNLPDPVFTKVNQTGGSTSSLTGNVNWGVEMSLDVEWAHAIAPAANILLVEANNSSFDNLAIAVQYAASQPGVAVVSMSWGGADFSGENSLDSTFVPPSSNPNVVFVASTGDSASPPYYPAVSPNVLAVGGTTLNLTSQNNWSSETGWSESGGGISAYESQPSYQKGIVTQSSTQRTVPRRLH